MDARYVQRSETVDYRPIKSISAGEIIVLDQLVGVAKFPISAGELGALALTGVYDVTMKPGCVFKTGSLVFWDDVNKYAVDYGEILLGLAANSTTRQDKQVRVILNSGGISASDNPENELVWQTI